MLVVSGGGQLDDYWGGPWRQPYALFKWTLLARLCGAAVVYLSVGTCTLGGTSQALLRPALKRAVYRSFRDEGSRALASFAAVTVSDPVVPDLAFSFEARASRAVAGERTPTMRIGVSPIAYLSRHWPESDSRIYSAYLDCLVRFIVAMAGRGHSISVLTSDAADWSAVEDMRDALRNHAAAIPPDRVEFLRTFTLREFMEQVGCFDMLIASRLHGVLLAHVQLTPTLAVSYDRKVDAHMHDMGQDDYRLDIRTMALPQLLTRAEALAADAHGVRLQLQSMRETHRSRLAVQYDQVFNNLK